MKIGVILCLFRYRALIDVVCFRDSLPKLVPARNLPTPETLVTTLPNGVRVASQETYGQVAALGAFLDAGSMYEPSDRRGLCHMLEVLAFHSTDRHSSSELSECGLCQHKGIMTSAVASRDVLMYRADVLRSSVPEAVSLIADTLLRPKIDESALENARQTVLYHAEDNKEQPTILIQELLHEAAYGSNTPLGHTLYATEEASQQIGVSDLERYMEAALQPHKVVVTGAGVAHDELVEVAEKEFGHLTPVPEAERVSRIPSQECVHKIFLLRDNRGKQETSHVLFGSICVALSHSYVGSIVAQPYENPPMLPGPQMSHFSMAFPTVGWTDRDVVPICVLDTLLGGGMSFSAGGPGKGMYSRFYKEVMQRYPWMDAANAFSLQFSDHGLFGVYASAPSEHLRDIVDVMLNEIYRLSKAPPNEEELYRARNQLMSSVLMNLESRGILCEDIGRQVLTLGKRMDPGELCNRILAVTNDDLVRVSRQFLGEPVSVAFLNGPGNNLAYNAIQEVLNEFTVARGDTPKRVPPTQPAAT